MSAEDFEGIKELAKQNHDNRIAKTPERLAFAKKLLEENGIEYYIKSNSIGHIHAYGKNDGLLYQFWVGTGKILGNPKSNVKIGDRRGIHSFIKILMEEK